MNNKIKLFLCVVGIASAFAAQAYEADISVNANIDPTVSILQSNGAALPSSVDMSYAPGKGLEGYKTNMKFWSNAQVDLNVSLAATPQLTDANGNNPIPLTVTLNNTQLTTTAATFQYSTLFPNGLNNGSLSLPLAIKQTKPTDPVMAGTYTGQVSIMVSQGTTKNGVAPTKS